MLIKIIGGLMIIFSSSSIGFMLSNSYSARPKLIRKLRFSLQMLETEIVFGTTPLPYAFKNISQKVEKPLSSFFFESSKGIQERRYFTMEEAWRDSVNKHLKNTYFSVEDIELIIDFGKVIGRSDIEDQKKHFKLIYTQLKHHEDIAELKRKRNERMYRSLGFLIGLAIFIIII